MEHVLELQDMDTPDYLDNHGGGGSDASLLLCQGTSSLSVTDCH
jgi:hypothetical protein